MYTTKCEIKAVRCHSRTSALEHFALGKAVKQWAVGLFGSI